MGTLIDAIRHLSELVIRGADPTPDLFGLFWLGAVVGLGALAVVRVTTNQSSVATARDRMSAMIYEARIFLDSPRRVLTAQARLIGYSAKYVALTMPALVLIILPIGLQFLQLQLRYDYAPLTPGESALLEIEMREGADPGALKVGALSEGLSLSAPPFVVADEGRVYVRLEVQRPGVHVARLEAEGHTIDKLIVADPSVPRVSPERRGGIEGLWAMGYEPAIPSDAPVLAIGLEHPPKAVDVLGMPWWAYWMLASIVLALGLRRPLQVEI